MKFVLGMVICVIVFLHSGFGAYTPVPNDTVILNALYTKLEYINTNKPDALNQIETKLLQAKKKSTNERLAYLVTQLVAYIDRLQAPKIEDVLTDIIDGSLEKIQKPDFIISKIVYLGAVTQASGAIPVRQYEVTIKNQGTKDYDITLMEKQQSLGMYCWEQNNVDNHIVVQTNQFIGVKNQTETTVRVQLPNGKTNPTTFTIHCKVDKYNDIDELNENNNEASY